jgi:hypothetical protein
MDGIPLCELDEFRRVATAGCYAVNLSVLPEDQASIGATEADRILHQVFQNWQELELRADDDLQHVGGGRLPL